MIKAILFDRDGVLIDSEDIHYQSVIFGLKKFGIICNKLELSFITGKNPIDYKKTFLNKYNLDWGKYRKLQNTKYYEILNSKDIIITYKI
jgi:beta-phosphoglucomutase-like phosphatase (HAD superfamily)